MQFPFSSRLPNDMCSAMMSVGKLYDCQQIVSILLLELSLMANERLIYVYGLFQRI